VAINFPTSLDNFTNPVSGNTLDSPSHSLQHSDINDAVEAMQRKVGVGTAVAGSASAGQVLTISAAGTSTWSTLPASGGLVQVVPTSVAVGSGSGSVDANGAVTFTGASSISLNGCFTSTYDNYRVFINLDSTSSGTTSNLRFRASGTDNSSSNYAYVHRYLTTVNTTYTQGNANTTTLFRIGFSDGGQDMAVIDIFNPMKSLRTGYQSYFNGKDGANFNTERNSGQMTVTTAYDGFTYIQNSMAGTIRVYGYKN
jgi:hypothetical protein